MDITNELTIIIPVRIDGTERKNNLDAILSYLLKTTHATVIVLEADSKQRYTCAGTDEKVKYIFIEDDDPIFFRTCYINKLLRISETNIVGIWDTDVILHWSQIVDSVKAVKEGTTLCYPYDGSFLFLDKEQSRWVRKDIISFLSNQNIKKPYSRLGRTSVGGAFIVNKEKYLQAGGENENFYGWGFEDTERFKRMEILEEPTLRVPGVLYHLYHPRGINSTFGNDDREKNNLKELIKVCRLNQTELREYIISIQ